MCASIGVHFFEATAGVGETTPTQQRDLTNSIQNQLKRQRGGTNLVGPGTHKTNSTDATATREQTRVFTHPDNAILTLATNPFSQLVRAFVGRRWGNSKAVNTRRTSHDSPHESTQSSLNVLSRERQCSLAHWRVLGSRCRLATAVLSARLRMTHSDRGDVAALACAKENSS